MTDTGHEHSTGRAVKSSLGKLRLGFVGVGWIGRSRLQALAESGLAEVSAIADPDSAGIEACEKLAPEARVFDGLSELLSQDLDAVVIATPSALHAEQAVAALNQGLAVFCQTPLGRNALEVKRVVEAARRADRLLGVDLSYRWTQAASVMRDMVHSGRIGKVFHADLVFDNAYGPDKPWFYDLRLAGGGCLIDLGVHLVDLSLWVLGFPEVVEASSRLYNKGVPLRRNSAAVEDFATAQLLTAENASITMRCSWHLHPGCDAVIAARFYGERGAVMLENVNGSFYDFSARLCTGTKTMSLAEPPDAWSGRAAVGWARRLQSNRRFNSEADEYIAVAHILDRLYGRELYTGNIHNVEIIQNYDGSRRYSQVG
jgi:predicted dehydrogenase